MALSWKDWITRRFAGLQAICGSDNADPLDLTDAILGMDSALEAGLKAWLRENDHVPEQDKQRVDEKKFLELLKLSQISCHLNQGLGTTILLFHKMRNEVQHNGYEPPLDIVHSYLPAIKKLVECLGVDVAEPPGQPIKSNWKHYLPSLRGAYTPLSLHLVGLPAEQRGSIMGFAQLEAILGKPLPPSARKHREWWANHRGNSQARAWLNVGWKVDGVNLPSERVALRRQYAEERDTRGVVL